ncbi:MAG: cytochrome c family protein [Fimbriimonadaceae bacterium]|nr:cytochrome c family protein [Fimbriimonadaceae bacterium]
MNAATVRVGLALGATVVAVAFRWPAPPPLTVVISGDTHGYLAPCGCTQPMTGGLRRRMAKVRQLAPPGPNRARTLVLDTGSFAVGNGAQDRLKAQTVAAALRSARVDAVAVGGADTPEIVDLLGPAAVRADGKVADRSVATSIRRAPFAVTSVDALASGTAVNQAKRALAGATVPVLHVQGDRTQAVAWARALPSARLVIYRSTADAPESPERVGNAVLVHPAHEGKSVLSLTWTGSGWSDYTVHRLGPEVADDPTTLRLYRDYLRRVAQADLFGQLPRTMAQGFVGDAACLPCHREAHDAWKATKHAHALETLEREGHDRDPDCVSCHVTGSEAQDGFLTRQRDPFLASVSCESCHGPGRDHVAEPKVKTRPDAKESCQACHTRKTSPNFNFLTYWARIRHGMGKNGG